MTPASSAATTNTEPAPPLVPVLVAEDDHEMRRLIVATLRARHFAVTEAADGMELLDHLEAAVRKGRQFAAIVSDVRMPLLSGMDVLAVLQAASADIPVVLITAFGDEATHDEALDLGALVVLDKPFEMDELAAVVARAAEGR